MNLIDIIDFLIKEANLRNISPKIIRLDLNSYKEFVKQVNKYSGQRFNEIGEYKGYEVTTIRETWENVIQIDIG